MKKIFKFFLLVFILLASFQTISYASFVEKFARGVTNIIVSPLEIPKHMIKAASQAKPEYTASFWGILYGVPKGAAYGVTRALSGAVDLVTFPLNIPKNWGSLINVGPFSFGETRESVLQDHS